ncbi:MAG: GNAT family N-acetyltransferase [Patescibacteria group bacterium]
MTEQQQTESNKSKERNLVELTDGIIVLKPFTIDDAEEHLHGDDIEQEKWLSGGKSTIDTVTSWIKRNKNLWESAGQIFNFSIRTAQNNKIVGMIEANIDSKSVTGIKEGDANISYGIYPEARGRGYVVRAINLIQEFLKEKRINRLVIRIDPENLNSLRIPNRCGFKKIGNVITEQEEKLLIFTKNLK